MGKLSIHMSEDDLARARAEGASLTPVDETIEDGFDEFGYPLTATEQLQQMKRRSSGLGDKPWISR